MTSDLGEYLWVYTKGTDGTWRIARMAGTLEGVAEEQDAS
jgi:hypothetical protein